MKYLIIFAVLFTSCASKEDPVLDWIKQAKKPVTVKKERGWSPTGRYIYHLTAADGRELTTPMVSLSLGDTLR